MLFQKAKLMVSQIYNQAKKEHQMNKKKKQNQKNVKIRNLGFAIRETM